MPLPLASPALPAVSASSARPAAQTAAAAEPAAFEALLATALVPSTTTGTAASVQPAPLPAADTAEVDPGLGDEESVEAPPMLATWMQWMRPLPAAMAEPGALAGSAEATPADATLPAPARALNAEILVLATLPQTRSAVAPEVPSGADAPIGMLTETDMPVEPAEPAEPEAPLPSNPATFAAALKAADTAPLLPIVMPDATLTVPVIPQASQFAPGASQAPMPAAPPPQLINTQHAEWTRQLGERIAWSVDEQQDAVIELHPAELGSLSVRVEMRGNDAQVTIVAASSAAREMLQQSLPQLRELLSVHGLNLARAQVERPSASNASSHGQTETGSRERGTGSRGRRQICSLLLVDAYA
jgi:flagellar hook-length control protein FliK